MLRRLSHLLFRTVRGRLVLLVAALLAPIAALAGSMVFQAYRNERATAGNILLTAARAVAAVVDANVDEADMLLTSFGSTNALDRDDFAGLDRVARRTLTRDDRWFVLLDLGGQQLVNTRLAPGTTLPKIPLDPELLPQLERGDLYVSNLTRSRATGDLVIHISRGYFRNGRLTYVLSLSLQPASLARAVDITRYAPGRIVTLLDRTGVIVARSRAAEQFVGGPAAPKLVRMSREHAESVFDSVTLEGISVLTAVAQARVGWKVALGAPKTELYSSARTLLLWGIVGAIALLGVAIVMSVWIGRALVHGAGALHTEAKALAAGGAPREIDTGLEEVDYVGKSMRSTAETLLRRTRMLEVQNRVNASLVAERDLERIIQTVIDAGCELTTADHGAFFYRPTELGNETLRLFTLGGRSRSTLGRPGQQAAPALAALFQPDRTLRVSDLTTELDLSEVHQHFSQTLNTTVRSCLSLPVRARGEDVIGWLLLGDARVNLFTTEDEGILTGLAAEAAIAIENAKLYHALARELEAKSRAEAELRLAQDKLQEHARELEKNVQERTASLREAVAQMEEFSYTVSHDLRGPLRAMHAFADALVEDYGPQLDETARDYLFRIQRAATRMDELTTNLLRYSRVARADVQLQPTDLEKIVRDTIEHYPDLQPASADVEIVSPLLPVLAHGPSLSQCVANLLTNAAKFVRPGDRPKIVVRTEPRGRHVRIWIEDNGIGIPAQYHAGLFRIFERLPNSKAYEGTGVGLAIVRKATEKMGGGCGVDSDGTNGSRFWMDLPAS